MPAPLKVTLSEDEDLTLQELSLAETIPKRTRISHYFNWAPETVRVALKRWLKDGLVGLWDLPRSGRKTSWTESDWQLMEKWLNEERGYTSKQLAPKWSCIRKINLGSEQIRRILQKKLAIEENEKKTPLRP